ncbi:MAG: branched-chain amino acid ABC transporter substrate-binding protein [Hyphomicrobium sp.]
MGQGAKNIVSLTRLRPRGAVMLAALAIGGAMVDPARADLVIAVAGPVEGRDADRAATILTAVRDAAAILNAAGGANGETFAVESVDDGCARGKAADVAGELATRKVALVLGHPCTPAALAAADVYGKASILFIATATRHPALTAKRAGPTIFRIVGRDDRQGELAGRILARAAPKQRVAVVHDRSQYGRRLAEAAAAAFKRERGADPITATIIGGDLDYKRTVSKVKDAQIVFFAGFPLEGGLIYSGLRDAGSKAEFIGSDSLATEEFSMTFGERAKGVRVLVSSSAAAGLAAPAESSSRDDADAAQEAARARAAIEVFAAAARKAESNDPAKVAAALAAGTFVTALGPIGFTSEGDARIPSFQLVEWQGKAWGPASEAP